MQLPTATHKRKFHTFCFLIIEIYIHCIPSWVGPAERGEPCSLVLTLVDLILVDLAMVGAPGNEDGVELTISDANETRGARLSVARLLTRSSPAQCCQVVIVKGRDYA